MVAEPTRRASIRTMKCRSTVQLLLILLFTLLQSVAPLAHAHVNGEQANDCVHAVEWEHALSPVLDEPALSTPDSPAIGMPQQLSRDSHMPDLAAPPQALHFPPPAVQAALHTQHPTAAPKQLSTCQTPFAHAPPALA